MIECANIGLAPFYLCYLMVVYISEKHYVDTLLLEVASFDLTM